MQKAISAALLSLALVAPSLALADDNQNNQQNGNPENVVSVWGLTNSQVPHVLPGQTIMDAAGIPFTCPAFFSTYCVDITGTEYYKASARLLAHAAGASAMYAYWLTH